MMTFAFWSWIIVSVCIVLSMFKTIAFKKLDLEIATPDSTLLLGYLGATFGAYVTKRYHDVKNDKSVEEKHE